MPTTPAKSRRLLESGQAKVIRTCPFTIKLLIPTGETTQTLTHGVDTGSSVVGSAIVNQNNEVVYLAEIVLRNDIKDKMDRRRTYRRNRRNRKTRYRAARWLNRRNSIKKDRFSPTMVSKIHGHLKEIEYVKSILPVTKLILETGTFDPHKLKNPELAGVGYQRGVNYGFANTKAYVLDRDGYKCQNCKGKSKTSRLEVHHLVFRSNGGSDEESNLITLCKSCHDAVHRGEISLKSGKRKGQLKHATQMNSIRVQLLKRLDCEETFGYITKEHRHLMNLPKEHYNDAVAIACLNNIVGSGLLNTKPLDSLILKKHVPKGDYQQTKGIRSEQKLPTAKIQGFRKFDKVEYLGKEYLIKGRMATGYAILVDIDGNKIDLKPIPKFSRMKRLSARDSWVMFQKSIVNF
jgi:hypothetical protein